MSKNLRVSLLASFVLFAGLASLSRKAEAAEGSFCSCPPEVGCELKLCEQNGNVTHCVYFCKTV